MLEDGLRNREWYGREFDAEVLERRVLPSVARKNAGWVQSVLVLDLLLWDDGEESGYRVLFIFLFTILLCSQVITIFYGNNLKLRRDEPFLCQRNLQRAERNFEPQIQRIRILPIVCFSLYRTI